MLRAPSAYASAAEAHSRFLEEQEAIVAAPSGDRVITVNADGVVHEVAAPTSADICRLMGYQR